MGVSQEVQRILTGSKAGRQGTLYEGVEQKEGSTLHLQTGRMHSVISIEEAAQEAQQFLKMSEQG